MDSDGVSGGKQSSDKQEDDKVNMVGTLKFSVTNKVLA